jgi:amino acid adenylation domain-containing protein
MDDQILHNSILSSDEERTLLSYLLKEEGIEHRSGRVIQARPRSEQSPLSYAQQRLWFLDQLQPGLTAYNLVSAVRLDGPLDVAALERALSEIVRRHEVLRSTFKSVNGTPLQIIAPACPLRLEVIDLQATTLSERAGQAQRLASEEAQQPFDLARGPLFRAKLIKLSKESHVIVLVMHHIISDGWSMSVLVKEVAALYSAFTTNRVSPLEELPIQYADYANWQRERLASEVFEEQLLYWTTKLAGAPALLEMPADRPRQPVSTFRGASYQFEINPGLMERLKALSKEQGVTLFMTLLAAWQTLLMRYTRQTDIVVGTPVSGRTQTETEELIGLFVNTLALRTDLSDDPTFLELLQRVRKVMLDAYKYQDLPFEKLVEALRLERSLNHQPLVQVMFTLQNTPSASLELPGLKVSPARAHNGASQFDLLLSLTETGHSLAGNLDFSTDLFDAATAERMARHFLKLLESIVACPTQRLSGLQMLSPAERQQLLFHNNELRFDYPEPRCLHELFAAQAERTPQAVALVYQDAHWTYRELDERSNRLAHYLRAQGVGPEVRVGLLMERSIELMVGVLGILKAGGAYVPLDPSYPAERLCFMLEDSGARLVVTQERSRELISTAEARIVCLDSDHEDIAAQSPERLSGKVHSENLAYVIYTSGSTGQPKGVLVTHGNVAGLLAATEGLFNFRETDVWTLFHSYAFDFSVWEMWGALAYGGRLIVVPYWVTRTPEAFYQLLYKERVTVLNQTPSAFHQLMRADAAAGVRSDQEPESKASPGEPVGLALRLVIFGGEALEIQSLREWFALHGDANPQLVNMYGITETTVHVTYRLLRQADAQASVGSLIGARLPDLQLYVLDERMQPAPVGVPGELYVAGRGLGRGYLGRPELTAERFVPHPFSLEAGARLYRTGDLGRWLANGDLEYAGRTDEQVKVRGFRIELGEIEAVLTSHPAVFEASVAARTETAGEKRLVAYLVAGPELMLEELRKYLKQRLPDYMLPSAFVMLERLPLTPSGKVDRQSLPAPGPSRPQVEQAYVPPRNEVEEVLAAIWSDVLDLEEIGINDNFFDLGGDSIRSVRVVALAKERGLNFSVQQLFQNQTIEELGKELKSIEPATLSSLKSEPFALINADDRLRLPGDVEDAYPLAMMQAGMLYHMAYLPEQMIYHNVYSYHLRARLDLELFKANLQRIVERHPILRTSFELSGYSEPLQLVHRTAQLFFNADDISDLTFTQQEDVLDAFVEGEKWKRFDISRPPLVRFHIHRRTEETFNFTVSEFHPIFDGWSLHSLLAEIFNSYFARLDNGYDANLQPLSSSYKDFVMLERQALESEECRQFWKEQLSEATALGLPRWPASLLPQDAPRISKLIFPLSIELTQNLKLLARTCKVPLKSILLAAHLKAMSIITGQTELLTGLVSVGRPEESDGERVLGLFFNTLPFRLRLSQETWAELIQKTFKAELEMLPFRRYPIAAIQQQWGRGPLFESIFNYLHFHVLDGLNASGKVELIDDKRYWEETNLTLSTAFMRPSLSEGMVLALRYDTSHFSEEQIRALSDYYKKILEAMVEDASARHAALCFLSDEELHRSLVLWNDTKADYAKPQCVHQLFEEQVEKFPDHIAVVSEGEQLSYSELNRRANRLAHHLRARGVRPEMLVGIYLQRSAEMLVNILGVMKAGGAYMPLDPAYPRGRIASMLADAPVGFILTQQSLVQSLPPSEAVLINLDAERELIARHDEKNPVVAAANENLVYVFVTSGSTGRPKGVGIEHRQLFNYLNAMTEKLRLEAGAAYAMVSTFATDLANTVIFPALCTGGCLHVISSERASDAEKLADYLEQHPVDCLKITPSHLTVLLASARPASILPRKRLLLGGDVSHWELIETIQQHSPEGCVILNHYGPTEATVGVMTYPVRQHKVEDSATLPLGRPLGNTQIYILDTDLHPIPLTVPGEIYIGGENLARGYQDCPEMTAERFIPNPFSDAPGARLYRTGDSARFLPDGNVEFLGRIDRQVKIRGYRVELEEIEGLLRQHPAVRDAVTVILKTAPGIEQLTAYVVCQDREAKIVEQLRGYLRENLPEHMLPTAFVLLDALPLAPSGKVDRRALPLPGISDSEPETSYVAPQNELEQVIAGVWQEMLQVERLSVRDNLFDLGGHSLILLQIQSKLRIVLNRSISIIEMFEHPTVSSLAKHLSRQQDEPHAFEQAHQEAAARHEALKKRRRLNRNLNT